MNRIDGLGNFAGADKVARRRATRPSDRGGAFVLPDDHAEAEVAVAGGFAAAAPEALGGMLAFQEAEFADAGEREAKRHGLLMLRELAALQICLLRGDAGADSLLRLQALAEAMPSSDQPALHHALQSLALRARVELARRGRGSP